MAIKPVTNQNALNKSEVNRAEQTSFRSEKGNARVVIRKSGGRGSGTIARGDVGSTAGFR